MAGRASIPTCSTCLSLLRPSGADFYWPSLTVPLGSRSMVRRSQCTCSTPSWNGSEYTSSSERCGCLSLKAIIDFSPHWTPTPASSLRGRDGIPWTNDKNRWGLLVPSIARCPEKFTIAIYFGGCFGISNAFGDLDHPLRKARNLVQQSSIGHS